MEKGKFVGPLLSKAKLEKLQEEYSIILCEIIEYITKNLGQSIEQQTIPEEIYKFWKKYSTRISIPKKEAIRRGYKEENDRFIDVRRIVNSKFHIFEEYEAEKDGVEQIIFLIEPKIISKPDEPKGNATRYSETISKEVKKFIENLSKDEIEELSEQIYINENVEIPITLPEQIHLPTLYKYHKRHKTLF